MLSIPDTSKVTKLLGEDKSLRKQLMLTFLAVGLIPLVILSFVSLWLSSSTVSDKVGQNLEAIKANKVVAIEKYGNAIVNQVITASADPNLATNLEKLISDFDNIVDVSMADTTVGRAEHLQNLKQSLSRYYTNEFLPQYRESNDGNSVDVNALLNNLNDEAIVLQHAYIEANPSSLGNKHEMFKSNLNAAYDNSHELLHQTFKIFLEEFGYYDIFLVDTRGRVVYSVYKELDYATNLLNGAYANSGLGEAFQASLNLSNANDFTLIDYAQYTPSYEAPASFIASPVMQGNTRIGSLIFQMPLDAITSVMSERRGLGETGESYLVGQDKLMRSDSIKFPDEYSVDASFRNARTVENDAILSGLNGESGVVETENYMGQDVLSGYIPVKFGSLNWVLMAEIETDEAFASVANLRWLTFALCLIAIGAIIYIAQRITTGIVKPVASMQEAMEQISESTDFSIRVNVESENEIGKSAVNLNNLLNKVEASIDETNSVVQAMANGDFSQRVESDFKGNLLTLKNGVNESASAIESSIHAVNDVVDALAHGDFNKTITLDLKGDLDSLKQGVNNSAVAIGDAIQTIGSLLHAMSQGDFQFRSDANLVGEYKVLSNQADSAMSSVDKALSEIEVVMSNVAKGELNARVASELPGQLHTIKENLNSSLNVINDVFSETELVLSSLADGNLSVQINGNFPGRMDVLKTNTNATVAKLNEVVREIRQASVTVSASADDIAQSNVSLSQRTEEQASSLEQTAASMDEITSTVNHTAENASHANSIASQAKDQAAKGGEVVTEAMQAMEQINDASSKIADIISVIDAIAFQTNLLALNAAVEAARAGEQGRGFAVVASEVRNLAGRSANAAKEIKGLIDDSVTKVNVGSELVTRSGNTLKDIIKQVENVSSIVGEISTATDEQSTGISEVHKAVEVLQELTQQNTAMVEEATAASEELGTQAKGMKKLIEFFGV